MLLRVQYQDDRYDYVDSRTLDILIAGREIRRFYRPSEEKWVNIDRDPIRGSGGSYSGPERRESYTVSPEL